MLVTITGVCLRQVDFTVGKPPNTLAVKRPANLFGFIKCDFATLAIFHPGRSKLALIHALWRCMRGALFSVWFAKAIIEE